MYLHKYLFAFTALLLFFACNSKTETKTDSKEFKINYEKFTLSNGLEVILHEDHSDPIVAVATMMHVGSNREKPGRTGFAHFFEHMSFNDSENVPVGANRKMIPEWGGSRNGGTSNDYTVYYEVVPKDAFEKILWIDSDRFGYMINTVTKEALEREKQVVKNEKRERVDNAAYGCTDEIKRKNLYPKGHPYNWTVIGALPDLQAATINDVKEFYTKYYGASNASLVIAGDIDVEKTKDLVKKWFGEIRKGPTVEKLKPMPVSLEQTKSVYFEDHFAKLPELRMTYPTVENYHEDQYALQILGQLLSGSKKSPLYKIIVEDQQLAPNLATYQNSSELAGEFIFRVRANSGTDLDKVKLAIREGLSQFEKDGVNLTDLKRIKAELETDLYQGVSTVLSKAFQLVEDNEFIGDPSYITKTAKRTAGVTPQDVMRVYHTYIKNKNYVMTSFVPKGQLNLAVTNAKEAKVWVEEVKKNVANEEVSQGKEAIYEKTVTTHDRSEPPFGELPLFKSPKVWNSSLENGLSVYGIENNEVPLVTFDITIPGGHLLDPIDKSGVASLFSSLMLQGTANKTAADLEEAIGLLGANINMYSSSEDLVISGSCLRKNFKQTIALVKEIIMAPRWDEKEFKRLKLALETRLKGRAANPNAIATLVYNKLLYGEHHIFGTPNIGTLESIKTITLDDLKSYYKNVSPKNAKFHIAGAIKKEDVNKTISILNDWDVAKPTIPNFKLPNAIQKNVLYFIDFPGAKQSVLRVCKLALSGKSELANNLDFANEILGGGTSGKLFQTLRIGKGYTYGAYSSVFKRSEIGAFVISTSVRANATLKSLNIIQEMVSNYANDFTDKEVVLTKDKILKANTRAFESLAAQRGMLRSISKYGLSNNYTEENQEELIAMTLGDYKSIITNYLAEKDMIYVVVGDKATQFEEVKKLGKKVIELDVYGNVK